MTQVTDHGGGVRSIKVPIPDNPWEPRWSTSSTPTGALC